MFGPKEQVFNVNTGLTEEGLSRDDRKAAAAAQQDSEMTFDIARHAPLVVEDQVVAVSNELAKKAARLQAHKGPSLLQRLLGE